MISYREARRFTDNLPDFYYAMAWHNYEHYAAWYMLGSKMIQKQHIDNLITTFGPQAAHWYANSATCCLNR